MPFIDITPHNNNVNLISSNIIMISHKKQKIVLNTFQKNLNLILSHYKTVSRFFMVLIQKLFTEQLIEYITTLIDNIDGNAITMENHTELTANNPENTVYHCCKVMYLINQYNEVGYILHYNNYRRQSHVRASMFSYTCTFLSKAYNEKIIVWDRHNKFSNHQEHHYHSMNGMTYLKS